LGELPKNSNNKVLQNMIKFKQNLNQPEIKTEKEKRRKTSPRPHLAEQPTSSTSAPAPAQPSLAQTSPSVKNRGEGVVLILSSTHAGQHDAVAIFPSRWRPLLALLRDEARSGDI
jgi:hypothetical protein